MPVADEEGRRVTGAVLLTLEQLGIEVQPWQVELLQRAIVQEQAMSTVTTDRHGLARTQADAQRIKQATIKAKGKRT